MQCGQSFLLLLPDSHSVASCLHLGRACPPLGPLRICCTCNFLKEIYGGAGGWGGGVHSHVHASLSTIALGASVGSLGIGRSTRSRN